MVKSMQTQRNNFFRRFLNKRYRLNGQVRGFTLIELLIASVIGVLIVGTMMTFVFSVADTDRQEQAKATAQEEIQSALRYIADDMREAVYIYDADGLNSASTFPNSPGIGDSLPSFSSVTDSSGVPVLVFWKRYIYKADSQVATPPAGTGPSRDVKCLQQAIGTTGAACIGNDVFRYSLVAYYLVRNNGNTTWSNAARIVRYEIKDGITTGTGGILPCLENVPPPVPPATESASCPPSDSVTVGVAPAPVVTTQYYVQPDNPFRLFSLSGSGGLKTQMNGWTRATGSTWSPNAGVAGNGSVAVLVDFIDDTPFNAAPYAPPTIILNNTIDGNGNHSSAGTGADSCNGDNGVGSGVGGSQRVPATFSGTYTTRLNNPASTLTSFYACVNSTNSVARIYIRGNALVRLSDDRNIKFPTASNSAFLPTANLTVYARGVLIPG
jgi:prepilin-type N-terminal cleavage/methylation domain-containing protein